MIPRISAGLFVLGLCLLPRSGRADEKDCNEIVPIKVQKGDTCAAIARRLYGDPSRVDLIHDHNAMGPPPHDLETGQELRVPRCIAKAAPGAPDARLTFYRNEVELQTPAPKPASKDAPLARGNRVSTANQSAAQVTFRDETQLLLGERTLIVILGDVQAAAAKVGPSQTVLVSGALRSKLGALAGKSTTLKTDSATVTLGAGQTQVTVDDKKTTRLAVYQGKSTLSAQKKDVEVPENFGSKAEAGKMPTPPRPLPAAPVWVAHPSAVVLGAGSTIDFSGEYGKGGAPTPATYHVEVARDAEFHDIIVDTRVAATVTKLDVRNVANGTYFAHVSAIDDEGFEGRFGDTSETRVVTGARAATRSDEWTRQPALEADLRGLYCSVDGSSPSENTGPIALDRFRAHRVRCAKSADMIGASEIVVPADPLFVRASTAPGVLQLDVDDGHGHSVTDASILASAPGATLGSFVATSPGRYEAKATWPAARSVMLSVAVNSGPTALAALDVPGSRESKPSSSASDDTRRVRVRFGAGGGVLADSNANVGGLAFAHLGASATFGRIEIGAGVRGAWEGTSVDSGRTIVDVVGWPIDVRVRALGPLQLGVQVQPLVALATAHVSQPSGNLDDRVVAGGQLAGTLALPLGPGSIVLEAGYRLTTSASRPPIDANASGFRADLGYLLAF